MRFFLPSEEDGSEYKMKFQALQNMENPIFGDFLKIQVTFHTNYKHN